MSRPRPTPRCHRAGAPVCGYSPVMYTNPRCLPWRKRPTRTATDEFLEEAKRQGHEDDTDDTDAAGDDGGGADDPITPSLHANRKAAEGHPSGGVS